MKINVKLKSICCIHTSSVLDVYREILVLFLPAVQSTVQFSQTSILFSIRFSIALCFTSGLFFHSFKVSKKDRGMCGCVISVRLVKWGSCSSASMCGLACLNCFQGWTQSKGLFVVFSWVKDELYDTCKAIYRSSESWLTSRCVFVR